MKKEEKEKKGKNESPAGCHVLYILRILHQISQNVKRFQWCKSSDGQRGGVSFSCLLRCVTHFLTCPGRLPLVNQIKFTHFPFVGTLQFMSVCYPSLLLYFDIYLLRFWCMFWSGCVFVKRWPFDLIVWLTSVLISWRMRCLMSPVYRNNDRWLIWNSTDTAWPGMLRSPWKWTNLVVGSFIDYTEIGHVLIIFTPLYCPRY